MDIISILRRNRLLNATVKSTGLDCKNKAYYLYQNVYVCGVHSTKDKRVQLETNPNKKEIQNNKLAKREEKIESMRSKRDGDVILCKMKMMKEIEYKAWIHLCVFPNYKHQNRKDGFGCASLSPKSMGPVIHGQKGLPIAKNLENFHQGNKVFLKMK